MRSKIIGMAISLVLVCSSFSAVFADSPSDCEELSPNVEIFYIDEDGKALSDDMRIENLRSISLQSLNSGDIETRQVKKPSVRRTVVKTTTKTNQFVGYNSYTPDWAKVREYTITSGSKYSWSTSYTWEGFSFGLSGSTTNGVKRVIDADGSKYSRLAVKQTMKYEKIKVEKILGGVAYNTYYEYKSTKIGAPTTYVKYK